MRIAAPAKVSQRVRKSFSMTFFAAVLRFSVVLNSFIGS